MIVGFLSDPVLCRALRRAALPEEDVLLEEADVEAALRKGFPRFLVHGRDDYRLLRRLPNEQDLALLALTPQLLARWDADRRGARILRSREDYVVDRLKPVLRGRTQPSWVDLAFRDLSRAAGAPLPPALRGFARRVMEFPARYDDLHGLGFLAGLSRGALKARFRRRGLASPYTYLRWFRAMAAAHVLREPSVTTLQASHRLGFTTDGNFCRAIVTATCLTPTEIRSPQGWHRLLILFSLRYLDADALRAWGSMQSLFVRERAA